MLIYAQKCGDVEGNQVRSLTDEKGEPWFIAKDVAEVLGYTDTDQAIRKHCKHAKLFKPVESTGLDINPRGMNIIPESDVYRLIIRSKLPAAERFERWIMEEVLPSLRKSGGYMMTLPEETPEEVMAVTITARQHKYFGRYCAKPFAKERDANSMRPSPGICTTPLVAEGYTLLASVHRPH